MITINETLKEAIYAAIEGGIAILDIYESDDIGVQVKDDKSPLTLADLASNTAIMARLEGLGVPIISEENKEIDYEERRAWSSCWLVDPLDGTKEFIKRNGEFTVNIALIENQKPVFGVIYVPVTRDLYVGFVGESKAFKVTLSEDHAFDFTSLDDEHMIAYSAPEGGTVNVVGSRSHMNQDTEDYINELKAQYETVNIVSKGSSLKFCLVAEGGAHLYPRYAPTMEWDTAAGQAICNAVGLEVISRETGKELLYNRSNLLNSHFLVRFAQ
ncbi:3'(2'),5'-bisphosphate nucleotidase CysQ [Flagellimonas sp. DF-77]|uniref:3'(2'),5'-bisphosphate nucleotidase CysQ n=1 Tax=Flagellimonas algarum TaxID=3230298 RepID=UPI0033938B61